MVLMMDSQDNTTGQTSSAVLLLKQQAHHLISHTTLRAYTPLPTNTDFIWHPPVHSVPLRGSIPPFSFLSEQALQILIAQACCSSFQSN